MSGRMFSRSLYVGTMTRAPLRHAIFAPQRPRQATSAPRQCERDEGHRLPGLVGALSKLSSTVRAPAGSSTPMSVVVRPPELRRLPIRPSPSSRDNNSPRRRARSRPGAGASSDSVMLPGSYPVAVTFYVAAASGRAETVAALTAAAGVEQGRATNVEPRVQHGGSAPDRRTP